MASFFAGLRGFLGQQQETLEASSAASAEARPKGQRQEKEASHVPASPAVGKNAKKNRKKRARKRQQQQEQQQEQQQQEEAAVEFPPGASAAPPASSAATELHDEGSRGDGAGEAITVAEPVLVSD